MFKITKESIKPLAADESVYFRGLRYYKGQAVSNVTWSKANQQYRAFVKGGSQYTVTIETNADGRIQHTCNCPSHMKHAGACKHVIATLLFIEHYQEYTEGKQPENEEEKTAFQILDYFDRQEKVVLFGETFHIMVHLDIPELFKHTLSKAYVSVSAGAGRMYRVPNIKKFLASFHNQETITLGKEFNYIPGESRFYKDSQKVLNYLLDIYEIWEAVGNGNYFSLFSKSSITFSRNMLIKLLKLLEGSAFQLELYGKSCPDTSVKTGNPEIHFDLEVSENRIKMEYHDINEILPISEDGCMMFYKNTVYLPEKEFITSFVPFYGSLVKNKNSLYFSDEQKDKFIELVLPRIHETMKIDIPDNLKDNFIQMPLKPSLYLDKYKSYIKADVVFGYGDYQINPVNRETPEGVIIIRDREAENEFIYLLEKKHFSQGRDGFFLKKDEDIYCFLNEYAEELKEYCTLYYSEDFKKIAIRPAANPSSSARVSEDNRFLELNLSYDGISVQELRELYHNFQVKKKYYRLKDGSFICFSDPQMEHFTRLYDRLGITAKNLKEDKIVLPVYQSLDLEYLIGQIPDMQFEKKNSYVNLVEQIIKPQNNAFLIPDSICGELRSYQVTGYKWLRSLAENHLGGILADDMGLGKTLQAITYMTHYIDHADRKEQAVKHMVVCPTSLVYNWQEEFRSFSPHIRCVVINGTPEAREHMLTHLDQIDVVISSYPLLRRDIIHYESIIFHSIFIDEAQFIKNNGSQNAKSVKQLNAIHRFALTGTPVENSLSELWSIFDYIMPGFLLSHSRFSQQYEKPIIRNGDKEILEELLMRIRPFILRRMKGDVLKELPSKIETKMLTDLTEQQKKVYLSYLDNIKKELFDQNGEQRGRQMEILAALTRLRQICCHPSTFLKNYKGGSGKLTMLLELVENILEGGHRILIFSQFTTMLDLIAEELVQQNIEYFYLEGSTKTDERMAFVRCFNMGERSIFLISLKAGGTGLNLTGADTVIHFDPWWNPAVEEQASDRAHRIGQKSSVHVIRLLARDTIEEKIYRLQQKKKQLADSVIQSKEVFVNQLTAEELKEIFSDT